jgi:hypothetical protein
MFYGKKLITILIVLTLLFLVNSCAGLQINPPGPSTQALLIIPVEVDAKVVSVRHHFYYIYEITRADDTSFSYDVEIKFPIAGDMLIVDSLAPGDYYVRKFTIQQIGVAEQSYGKIPVARNDRFSLESGKITIFSKSLKIIMRAGGPRGPALRRPRQGGELARGTGAGTRVALSSPWKQPSCQRRHSAR